MADDLPSPGKAVFLFFDYIALGFVLGAVEEFLRDSSSWHRWAAALGFAAVFLFIGVKGPKLAPRLSQLIERLRNTKVLQAALTENGNLKTDVVDRESQIDALRIQHAKDLENRRLSLFEEMQAKHPASSMTPTPPHYGRNLGFRIESATFAAHADPIPASVIAKVRERAKIGESIPVNWEFLLGGDPHQYATKYLTIAYSITETEGESICLPNGMFIETLDQLALNLKTILQDSSHPISSLFTDAWMTQIEHWEVIGRKARQQLFLLQRLGGMVGIRTSQLDRRAPLEMLYEVEKIQRQVAASGAEVRVNL